MTAPLHNSTSRLVVPVAMAHDPSSADAIKAGIVTMCQQLVAVKALIEQDATNRAAITLYGNIRAAIQNNQKVLKKKFGVSLDVLQDGLTAQCTSSPRPNGVENGAGHAGSESSGSDSDDDEGSEVGHETLPLDRTAPVLSDPPPSGTWQGSPQSCQTSCQTLQACSQTWGPGGSQTCSWRAHSCGPC